MTLPERAPLRFVGVVPAAGASSRMGRPKGLLELDGLTFVERVVGALLSGGCEQVIVVVDSGDERLARQARDAGAHVLRNTDPGEGPITSLRLALRQLEESIDGIAYLPIDYPLVEADVVRALIDEAERTQAPLVLPWVGAKRGHPALLRRALFTELGNPDLMGGARTVVHAHLHHGARVDVDGPGPVTDVDTPEDLERARAIAADRTEATRASHAP